MLTNRNLISNVCQNVYARGLDYIDFATAKTQPKTVVVLPMFHIFGLAVTSLPTLHVGGQLITLSKFESTAFVNAIDKYKPTFLQLVPPLVSFLANDKDVKPSHLESVKYVQVIGIPLANRFSNFVFHK